jgi:predicted acetyltransferase
MFSIGTREDRARGPNWPHRRKTWPGGPPRAWHPVAVQDHRRLSGRTGGEPRNAETWHHAPVTCEQIEVLSAGLTDKDVVRQLLEFNAYEFSRLDELDLDDHGRFGYRYLDHYWKEADRHPYLIRARGRIAGMALVREGPPCTMAEFLIMPKYRRAGIGTAAARELFSRHPGRWEVHQILGNDEAVGFWRRAIPCQFNEDQDEHGTVQRFEITE